MHYDTLRSTWRMKKMIIMASLFFNISQLVMPHATEGDSRTPLDVIDDAALLVDDGLIIAAGTAASVRARKRAAGAIAHNLAGRAVVPGLVDSHTHIVFAGDRIDEMARRARGESYEKIAAAGGGIVRSVHSLSATSEEKIVQQSTPRLKTMLAHGTTTCEVKTGYGLDPELELKQLAAIGRLAQKSPVDVVATVLAHVIPPAARGDRAAFVEKFCDEVLRPAAADKLAAFADVFIERGAYEPDEARTIISAAQALGLAIKLHVDQMRDGGGAALAAEVGALSADHLEHVSEEGRKTLADAGAVATILPGCKLYLGKGPWPDGRALRDAGCEVAVATDCNPGSSFITDLPLCGTMSATLCGLSFEEALWGITKGGAKALGLNDRGRLTPGERADFVVLDHADWRSLFSQPGNAPVYQVVIGGEVVG